MIINYLRGAKILFFFRPLTDLQDEFRSDKTADEQLSSMKNIL